jgi:hypothetical protein
VNIRAKSIFLALAACLWPCALAAQTASPAPCVLEAPNFTTNAPDIFNDRQEQDLGDALAEYFEADMHIAPPSAGDELTRIGEKMLATLPPTGIHYSFRIYDSGEVNAFSVAGGRVYVSRKLIAAVTNEDELAGVLAHELGHLATHQTAVEMTYLFKVRMGVTQVGDRADVFAKVHQFLRTPPKDTEAEVKETQHELVADHVAIYALIRAGYAAESFPAFFNQISMNKGKTGNWLSDHFGLTNEDSRRYREAMKLVSDLPSGCTERKATASETFQAWQHGVVQERVKEAAESATGDTPIKLDPPLRPSPWRIRFSPDGKKVLVQDEGSITVVDIEAQKVLFRIDAPEVNEAQFTPDSASLVFDDSNLRVERWNAATGERTDVKELVLFDGCDQSRLAPDGKTLVCLKLHFDEGTARIGLSLIDVATGKPYFDKPKFYEVGLLSSFYNLISLAVDSLTGTNFANIQMDQEGRHLVVAIASSAEAFDLEKRQPVPMGGKLKNMGNARMAFMGPDAIFAAENEASKGLYKAQVLSFPDGKVLNETQIGDQGFHGATKGPLLLLGPLKDFPVGIFDPATSKVLAGWQFDAIDVWDKKIAAENGGGGLFVSRLGATDSMQVPLPLGPLPPPRAAGFSPDGKYLVVSLRSRSEIWDMATGKQVHLMRPISSLWVDDQDCLWAMLPKYLEREGTKIEMPLSGAAKDLGRLDEKERQYENLLYTIKPIGKGNDTGRHVTLEVKNMETQAVLWSHEYPAERPAVWPSDDGRMVLAWDLSADTAREELKKYPKAQQEAKALTSHKKGLLIETVMPETGAPLEQVALPEVDLSRGWNDARFAQVSGEYALVRGEHSNTVIYRIDTGDKVGEFFGAPLATDSGMGLIAAENREDEILLVNERTGKEIERFTLGSPARLARIVNGKEKKLLVLTADQVVHELPLPEMQNAAR